MFDPKYSTKFIITFRRFQDNKILTSWSSLAISGLAYAARAIPEKESEYLDMAKKAFDFIAKYSRKNDGSLIRAAYVDDQGMRTEIRFVHWVVSIFLRNFSIPFQHLKDHRKVFNTVFLSHRVKSFRGITNSIQN